MSRQRLSNEHTMSSVRQFRSFDPSDEVTDLFGPGETHLKVELPFQRVSGMAGNLSFASQFARPPKKRFCYTLVPNWACPITCRGTL